jgi:hypothetical protein
MLSASCPSRARAAQAEDDAYSRGLAGVDVSNDDDVQVRLGVLAVDEVSSMSRWCDALPGRTRRLTPF